MGKNIGKNVSKNVSKTSLKNNLETNEEEILRERYIPPELKQNIADD